MQDKLKILTILLGLTTLGCAGSSFANNNSSQKLPSHGKSIAPNLACHEPAIISIAYPIGGPTIYARILTPKLALANGNNGSEEPVTLVNLKPDGKVILIIPEGKAFLELSDFSLQAAEKRWGPAVVSADGIKTFDLVPPNGTPIIFHLDTKFTDSRLISYRLRGPEIKHPTWATVQ